MSDDFPFQKIKYQLAAQINSSIHPGNKNKKYFNIVL